MIRIFDTAWSVQAQAQAMKHLGLETVIRYINHRNSHQLPEKCITASERATIKAAGLELVLVFQQRQNQQGDFTAEAGDLAATRAFEYARDVVGRPSGRPIYFSVDCDVVKPDHFKAVEAFFTAINDRLKKLSAGGAATPVGVYGCGAVCQQLKAAGLATYFWLPQSTGWNGHKAFLASGDWHLNQGPETTFASMGGDPNDANPAHPDFGAFMPTL